MRNIDNYEFCICNRVKIRKKGNFFKNRLFKKYRGFSPKEFRKKHFQNLDFTWDKQVTPWQFVPTNENENEILKPVEYSTKILHL